MAFRRGVFSATTGAPSSAITPSSSRPIEFTIADDANLGASVGRKHAKYDPWLLRDPCASVARLVPGAHDPVVPVQAESCVVEWSQQSVAKRVSRMSYRRSLVALVKLGTESRESPAELSHGIHRLSKKTKERLAEKNMARLSAYSQFSNGPPAASANFSSCCLLLCLVCFICAPVL